MSIGDAKDRAFTDEKLDFIISYDIKYRMGGRLKMRSETLLSGEEVGRSAFWGNMALTVKW